MAKRKPLTDLAIRRAKPGTWLSDPQHRGLRLYVGDGGINTWWYRFRSISRTGPDGKPTLDSVRIGTYLRDGKGELHMPLEAARAEWRRLKTLRSAGTDPKAHFLKQTEKPFTVAKLVDLYLREWARPHKKSFANDSRILFKDLVSRYGDEPAARFSVAMARDMLEAVAERGEEAASQLLAVCRRVWNFGIERDHDAQDPREESKKQRTYMVSNPFAGRVVVDKKLVSSTTKKRRAKPSKAIWDDLSLQRYLRWAPSSSLPAMAQQITLIQLYTGARPGEVVAMRWADVDLERAVWTVPPEDYKTGVEHNVMLSTQAVELIKSLPRNGEWIFPSIQDKREHISYSWYMHTRKTHLSKAKVPVKYVVPHALRHSVATGLSRARVPTEVISRILGHKLQGMTEERYQHDSRDDQAAEALQKWCDHLDALQSERVAAMAG